LFSRGCPFQCTYCSNHAIAKAYNSPGNLPRFRSPQSSIREIEETLRAFPFIRRIAIVDDIFGQNKQWRNGFLKLYKERINHKFICLLRANVVDETFMMQLSEAGCEQISFGVESGNDYVRNEIMKRNMDEMEIVRAFRLAHEYGIKTNAINIIGVPGETDEMIWDTIRLNRKLKPTISCVNIFYPYEGTVLGDECFEKNLVNEAKYESFTLERRATVLNFCEGHLKKLDYYYGNWQALVFQHGLLRRLYDRLRKRLYDCFHRTPVWTLLRTMKRLVMQLRDVVKT